MPIFVWLLAVATCLYGLQLFPQMGIYLMFLGGGIITGALLMLSLISLFVEAVMKRVPRWFVVVPIVALSGYYGLLCYERLNIPTLAAQAGIEPTIGGLVFDPEQHAIDQRHIDPHYILARYQIPEIHDLLSAKVRTIGETRSCENITRGAGTKNAPGAPIGIRVDAIDLSFCFTYSASINPTSGLITFEPRSKTLKLGGIQLRVRTLAAYLDGREIGGVNTIKAEVLPWLPLLFAGCYLNSGASRWDCGVFLYREWVEVWPKTDPLSASLGVSRAFENDQIANLLSLKPRSPEETIVLARLPENSRLD